MDVLLTHFFPALFHLHLHLHRDVVLYAKCVRILKEYLKQARVRSAITHLLKGGVEEEIKEKIEKLIGKVFLPALSMIPSNPGIANETWELLKIFPYTTRL